MAVPHILPESQVNVFKFYDEDAIHEAVIIKGRVMRLAGIFSADQKREAFDFAYSLCQEYFTLMTPSAECYRVWVDVRCPTNFNLGTKLNISSSPGVASQPGLKRPAHSKPLAQAMFDH